MLPREVTLNGSCVSYNLQESFYALVIIITSEVQILRGSIPSIKSEKVIFLLILYLLTFAHLKNHYSLCAYHIMNIIHRRKHFKFFNV